MTAKDAKKKNEPGFDKALERLEAIVNEMESGKLGIETMIERFEEGQKLIQWSNRKLNDVEQRIEVLIKKGEQLTTEPLETATEKETEPDEAHTGELF